MAAKRFSGVVLKQTWTTLIEGKEATDITASILITNTGAFPATIFLAYCDGGISGMTPGDYICKTTLNPGTTKEIKGVVVATNTCIVASATTLGDSMPLISAVSFGFESMS